MTRREEDGNRIVKLWRYSFIEICVKMFGGGFFVAFGLYFLIYLLMEIVKDAKAGEAFDAFIIFPFLITLVFVGVGGFFFGWGIRDVYHWAMTRITKKKGEIGYATIADIRSISKGNKAGPNINRKYGFDLLYEKDGVQRIGKTDTVFDINECRYLKSLPQVRIKIYKNFVVIDEEFRYEIYKVDSRFGIDKKYFVEKPFSTILNIWRVVTVLSFILFFVLFALTISLKVNTYLFVGFGLLTFSNLLMGIVYAVCFFTKK